MSDSVYVLFSIVKTKKGQVRNTIVCKKKARVFVYLFFHLKLIQHRVKNETQNSIVRYYLLNLLPFDFPRLSC